MSRCCCFFSIHACFLSACGSLLRCEWVIVDGMSKPCLNLRTFWFIYMFIMLINSIIWCIFAAFFSRKKFRRTFLRTIKIQFDFRLIHAKLNSEEIFHAQIITYSDKKRLAPYSFIFILDDLDLICDIMWYFHSKIPAITASNMESKKVYGTDAIRHWFRNLNDESNYSCSYIFLLLPRFVLPLFSVIDRRSHISLFLAILARCRLQPIL